MATKAEVTQKAIELIKADGNDLNEAFRRVVDFQRLAKAHGGIEITDAEAVQIVLDATGTTLPELTGSEKQVAWATDLRIKLLLDWLHPLRKEALTQTSAAWFIGNR